MDIMGLSPKVRLELASMAYSRWCLAFEELKAVKVLTWEGQNKFCPKAEWPLYHGEMIKEAEKELRTALEIKEAFCNYSPLVTGE